jgi:hypothetical protein
MNNVFDLFAAVRRWHLRRRLRPAAGQYQGANLVRGVKETFLKAGRISVSGATRAVASHQTSGGCLSRKLIGNFAFRFL